MNGFDRSFARARAVCAGAVLPRPAETFVIVCLPRTGSELLVDLLDSHPAIRCESEILREPMRFPDRFLRGRAAIAARHGARAWGAKIIYHQLSWYPERYGSPARFLRGLRDSGYQVISLARRNPLEQAISALQAIESDRYHYRAHDAGGHDRLDVAPEALVSMLWTLEQQECERRAALADLDPLELVYEDDLSDPVGQQRTADRICDWLELPAAPVRSTLQRRSGPSLSDRLADYPAVAKTLSTTRYAELLDASG